MALLESLSLSAIGKAVTTIWANGSRLLWSVAVAAVAAAGALRIAALAALPKAQEWSDDYGLALWLAACVIGVFAAFKTQAEHQTGVFLIADEEQSSWHHAKQHDSSIITHFALRLQVANTTSKWLHPSKVRIKWPLISRSRVLTARISTHDPMSNTYSAEFSIPPQAKRQCQVNILVKGVVGGQGRTKPMRVTIAIQDQRLRWHKLVFHDLRDPQFSR
ncbi:MULTISPECIES: hypothetical protein [unclassified Bradyrhizobium]|uniref:hypothetical protein n=1 Tax=unclassified Bradyrhizobium TaxID=2631580 RepID=UPI002916EC5D|nr:MULTISPECIES: hypothetical protein [unclassified Bradyrhizobium]